MRKFLSVVKNAVSRIAETIFHRSVRGIKILLLNLSRFLYDAFVSIRLSKIDILFAALIFILTSISSSVICHHVQEKRKEPFFLASAVSWSALTLYQTGDIKHCNPGKDPKKAKEITDFIAMKSSSVSNETAKQIKPLPHVSLFGQLYSINQIMSWWWKFIGYPSHSEFFICLGLIFGLTSVVTYFLLRTCGGAVGSFALTLLIQCSFLQLNLLWVFRDWSRVPPILPLLLLIMIVVRRGLSKKMAVCGGVIAGVSIGFGIGFRTDLFLYIPCLAVAVMFFPKFSSKIVRKIVFIAIAIIVATAINTHYKRLLPKKVGDEPGLNIAYIGQTYELLTDIIAPSECYTWSPINMDQIFDVVPAAIAEVRYDNTKCFKGGEIYNKTVFSELLRCVLLFPYDYNLLSFSGCAKFLQGSVYSANWRNQRKISWNAPVYGTIKIFSEDILKHVQPWTCLVVVAVSLLVVSMFHFGKFLFFIFLGLVTMSPYIAQLQDRHNFYLFIYVLLAANFIGYVLLRSVVLVIKYKKRALKHIFCCKRKYRRLCFRLSGVILMLVFFAAVLAALHMVQRGRLLSESKKIARTPRTALSVKQIPEDEAVEDEGAKNIIRFMHKVYPKLVHYDIPELNKERFFMDRKKFLWSHCEFLVLKFNFTEEPSVPLNILLRYSSSHKEGEWRPSRYTRFHRNAGPLHAVYYSNFNQWVDGPIHPRGELYFITPVYYCWDHLTGFQGISLPEEIVPYLREVSILKNRRDAPCNWQFFLSPHNFEHYDYHHHIKWDRFIRKM